MLTKKPKRIRFTSNISGNILIISDFICFALIFFISSKIYIFVNGRYANIEFHDSISLLFFINYILIRISSNHYSKVDKDTFSSARNLFDFSLCVAFSLVIALILKINELYVFEFIAIFFVCGLLVIVTENKILRLLLSKLIFHGYIGQQVAIYGADQKALDEIISLRAREGIFYFNLIGFADDRSEREAKADLKGLPFLGSVDDLIELSRDGALDQVMIVVRNISSDRFDEIIDRLSVAAVDICLVPSENLDFLDRYRVNWIGSLPVLSFWQRPIRDLDLIMKKILDVSIALLALVVLFPIILMTAIAIRLESPGNVIFKQRRFGFNNNEIYVYKFRSMYADRGDPEGANRTVKNDSRVTKVGRIIRRLSIDEIPQIFNVLRGEMSIVGPRPHATEMRVEDEYYHDAVKGYLARHRVKPGITGLAQTRGLRGEIQTLDRAQKRVEYDRHYIDSWSIMLDLRIIARTVLIILWDRDAY
jgi:polysaccharide biosynthesis protein PslA